MALFGMFKKKPFDQMPGMQPPAQGYGMGVADMSHQAPAPAEPMEQPRQKPNLLGILGDSLSIMGGGEATYVPQMHQARQQQQMQMQQMQQRQEQDMARQKQERDKFIFEREYERDNPKPVNNDTVNDLNFYKSLTPDDRALYHQMRPQFIPDGYGGGQWATPNGQGGQQQSPQPVGKLKPYGGQTARPSGNFRP